MIPKIAIDAKRAFSNRTGLGNYSRDLLRGIQGSDFQAEWLLYTPKPPQAEDMNSIDWLPEGAAIVGPTSGYRLAPALWRYREPIYHAHRSGAQIYHGISNELPQRIPSSRTLRIAATIHDLIPWTHPELFDPINRQIYRKKMLHAMRHADQLIAVSEYTKQRMESLMPRLNAPIAVIPPTVHPLFFQEARTSPTPSQTPYFLMVGRWEERKNIDMALRALRLLDDDSCELVLVGSTTAYTPTLAKRAEEWGVAHRVQWEENIDLQALRDRYQGALALLYISHTEGFGIPILEAFLSGTEVITNREGVFMEAGGKEARYVDVTHPESIASEMRDLLNSPKDDERIQRAVARITKQYHPDVFLQRHLDLYRQLL